MWVALQGHLPFAVVGSTEEVKIGNKMVRARQYPWGTVQGKCWSRLLEEVTLSSSLCLAVASLFGTFKPIPSRSLPSHNAVCRHSLPFLIINLSILCPVLNKYICTKLG